MAPAFSLLDLRRRRRFFTRTRDLKLQPLFGLGATLRVQNRLASLRIDLQRVPMASLEGGRESNLVLKGTVALGRKIVGHQSAIQFVEDPDPIIVNRKIGSQLNETRGFNLGQNAAIEANQLHSAIRELMAKRENQSFGGRV